ncbi:hypothetical protein CO054_01615 [Candidatus Shapirobacteria bacterium CG_4_9_14_0_2_um_filter_39_11]|uniref:O-antigen ligase-related domain-containing protein n=1 Tax=Candidatus Shapirobacteria bacterium CG_4_9_14_0_2_um_filter_39_11 TaxID=1974478 RepID=A0A2M8ESR4_9BACT|nr:MAG: hypothetical protein CO054_01615 [Candidatus Shapirobacteria bacterium CG_4_9_14_0_2_um_filter_39_11]
MTKLQQRLFWLLVFLLPVQFGRHFWPEWSYVMGLRIDYLSPTIYLTDILMVAILGLWGLEKISNFQFPISNFLRRFWWVLAVFAYLLVNSCLAQNQGAALYKSAKIIEFALLGFYIAKNKISLSMIRRPLSIAVVYSSLIAVTQFLKQASLGGVFWWLGERTFNAGTPGIAKAIVNGQLIMRPYATFPHPNVLAGFVLVSLILIGVRCQALGVRKIFHWLAIALGIVAILISFSRSAWVVGLLIGLWLMRKKPLLFTVYCLLSTVGVVAWLAPHFSANEAFSQRLQLIKTTWLMIQATPLIGVGLSNFIVRLPDFWQITGFTYWLQPVHNIYLLVAAETGLVGLVIFLWFLILTFRKLLEIGNWKLVIPLLAILLTGVADHYWLTLQQSQLLFAIILGLAWAKK